MIHASDTPFLLAMLVVSAGLCGASILLARWLGVDRLWRAGSPGDSGEVVEQLAALADAALRRGLLSIEREAATSSLPGLARGVELLASGRAVHEVRDTLLTEVDHGPGGSGAGSALLMTLLVGTVGLLGLGAACGAAWWMVASVEAATVPMVLSAAAVPAGIVLIGANLVFGRRAEAIAARTFHGLLVIEAVCMIGASRDGSAVRAALNAMLPRREGVPAAAAA
ncbi:MAG: hypothetical protein KF678_09330 [Phycisphaeraceae bacterium]|nr:hypothetical protein [Phycisphaeraceae bacterium]